MRSFIVRFSVLIALLMPLVSILGSMAVLIVVEPLFNFSAYRSDVLSVCLTAYLIFFLYSLFIFGVLRYSEILRHKADIAFDDVADVVLHSLVWFILVVQYQFSSDDLEDRWSNKVETAIEFLFWKRNHRIPSA